MLVVECQSMTISRVVHKTNFKYAVAAGSLHTKTTTKQHLKKSSQSNLGRVRRSRTTMQQCPHWLQWDVPNSSQNCPFFSTITTHPSTDPTHYPKQHPDPISRFATVHFLDRPTDRPTNGLGDRSVRIPPTLAILIHCVSKERLNFKMV